jgi:hypothetical protein
LNLPTKAFRNFPQLKTNTKSFFIGILNFIIFGGKEIFYMDKQSIKNGLIDKLIKEKSFWSYSLPLNDQVDDDILIEKSLLDLDIDDINLLFNVFPRERIKNVWENNILVLEPYYHNLNIFFGWFYFGIDNIDKHLKKILKQKRNARID